MSISIIPKVITLNNNDNTIAETKDKTSSTLKASVLNSSQNCTNQKIIDNSNLNCKNTFSSLNIKCRICFQSNPINSLVSPCKCTGSIKFLHKECLLNWIKVQNISPFEAKCEICHCLYNILPNYKRKLNKIKVKKFIRKHICIFFFFIALASFLIIWINIIIFNDKNVNKKTRKITRAASIVIVISVIIFLSYIYIKKYNNKCFDSIVESFEILNYDEKKESKDKKAKTTKPSIQLNNFILNRKSPYIQHT